MAAAPDVPTPDGFRFHCAIEVRFRDLDAMGHVNNAAYLTYFEVARTGYLRVLGHCPAETASMPELFPFVLLQVSCRYLAPATVGDTLTVYLRTTSIGSKSFEFEYLVTQQGNGEAVAVGASTQVYFDYGAERTMPIPPRFRQLLETLEGQPLSAG